MTEIGRRFEQAGGPPVQLNVGGSSFLARQIVEGAPVDVFVSADAAQMDAVEQAGRLEPGTRVALLSNTLVVIADSRSRERVTRPDSLAGVAISRVAMANTASVPAGVYGRQWLEGLGLWDAVEPKVVPLLTVRSALAAVREGRADAGIVYATDARTAPDVHVAYRVPASEGPPILYPAAVIAGADAGVADRFVAFLQQDVARQIFESAGFVVLETR